MDLINIKNNEKVIYIENLILKCLEDINKIKSNSDFVLNSNLSNNFINFYLNMMSYAIALNYFFNKIKPKVIFDLKNELENLIADFSLILNPFVLATPKELIDKPPILDINPKERFLIVKKLGYIIDFIKEISKGDSKVFFSLEEIYLKFIVFAKNIIDFKDLSKNLMLESPHYKYQAGHLKKVLILLEEGAFLLRTNYELKEYEEYSRQSLQYLEAGKILAMVTSQKEEVEKFTKMYSVWSAKFNSDLIKRKK